MDTIETEMVVAFIAILYVVFVLWLLLGWKKVPFVQPDSENEFKRFSILIPVRNEEKNIEGLLRQFEKQNYPKEHFEVLVINDHSTDKTIDILTELQVSFNFRFISLETQEGKKAALQRGVSESKFNTIVTTDADCRVTLNWLNSINAAYKEGVSLVFGPVTFQEETSFFQQLQLIEFASLVGSGAASLGNGKASMCNGANLSFTKDAFYRVNGYAGNEEIASGDDEFLMHKLYAENPAQVVFNKSKAGIVYTEASPNIGGFFQQRKRWASKWKYYENASSKYLAVIVFCFSMFYLVLPVLYSFGYTTLELWLTAWAAKLTLDFVFLSNILQFLGKKLNILAYFILSALYVAYVPLFAIFGSFGGYSWKNRQHH